MSPSNKLHESLNFIHADEQLIKQTKEKLDTVRHKKTKGGANNFRRNLGLVLTVLILAVGIGSYSFLYTPFSYVSIDVNPSLELVLNRFDWVIEAKAYNEDGKDLLENLDLNGKSVKDAILCIAGSEKMQEYIDENSIYTFTIASSSYHKENELCVNIEELSKDLDCPGNSVHSDLHCVEEAHKEDVSLGKYTAYQELLQVDDTITIEDCHHMSVDEMHHLAESHKSEDHHEHKHH